MWEDNQKTLKNVATFRGIGLHSGVETRVDLEPAESDSGIIFKRTDVKKNNSIKANFENVSSAKLCTKIENKFGASVSTIEHLMAAFYICGIDNLIVKVDGPEIPIMDGSADEFVKIINNAGNKILDKKRKFLKIYKKIELKEENKSISIEPSEDSFKVKFSLSYNNPIIKNQTNEVNFQKNDLKEIYSARTFCLFEDIEKVKKMGLAKGGSLDNAIVVKGDKILNKNGLRSDKEFVNHKILDLAGDFMLAGYRVVGSVNCLHGGHSLTNSFLRKLFSKKDNFQITEDRKISVKSIRSVEPTQKRLAVNA